MNDTAKAIFRWMRDPFGKDQVAKTHDPILQDMRATKEKADAVIKRRSEFPIGAMVGNPDFRRRKHGNTKNVMG